MNKKPLFILGLVLSIIHYFLYPPKNIFQILPGILINIYFLYVLLFFQRIKYFKYISTIIFILTFIQLIYYYHYRIFIPLGAYSFILNEPRMLQEVLLMANALYFIIPGVLFFIGLQRFFNFFLKQDKFCFKKNIKYLILNIIFFSLLVISSERLDKAHALPFSSNFISQIFSHPILTKKRSSLKKLENIKPPIPINTEVNILIIISDALRSDVLSASDFPKIVIDKSLQDFYKRANIFKYAISPSNMTGTSIPSIFTGIETWNPPSEFQKKHRPWDYFSNHHSFYLSTADVNFFSIDETLRTENLDMVWELEQENIHTLREILKDGDSLALKNVIGTINNSPKPFFGVWHMDGTHSYLHTPSENFPLNLPKNMHQNKKKYLHSAYVASNNIKKLLDNIDLSNTIIILTSDHGEGFGEHGYFFHFKDLHQESIRVPFIIYLPENLKKSLSQEKIKCLKEKIG